MEIKQNVMYEGPYIPPRWIVNREPAADGSGTIPQRRCCGSSGAAKRVSDGGAKRRPLPVCPTEAMIHPGKNSALHIFDVVCIESRLMTAHLPVDRPLLCMIDGRLQLKRKAEFDKGRAFYCAIQHCDISHGRVSWSLLSRRRSSFVARSKIARMSHLSSYLF